MPYISPKSLTAQPPSDVDAVTTSLANTSLAQQPPNDTPASPGHSDTSSPPPLSSCGTASSSSVDTISTVDDDEPEPSTCPVALARYHEAVYNWTKRRYDKAKVEAGKKATRQQLDDSGDDDLEMWAR